MTGTSKPSRSQAWEHVRLLENILARLGRARQRSNVIRIHAWREGSFDAIFDEVTAQAKELDCIRDVLSEKWEDLHRIARDGDE
jgi:coenzyme F420-reducing hydrogenase delta subunit